MKLWSSKIGDATGYFAMAIVVAVMLCAVLAPYIAHSPTAYDLDSILLPPSFSHLLGTDAEGHDVYSRLIWGARVSMSVGLLSVMIYVAIGVIMGALAGFFGGWIDAAISRMIEIFVSFPVLILILAALAFIGPGIQNVIFAIAIIGWPGVARIVRAEILREKGLLYVESARSVGASDARILVRHMLPNAIAPVIVAAMFGISSAIIIEASLSFLGFGVPVYQASWGGMLSQARYFPSAWWLTIVPGFAIFVTVLVFNVLGDKAREHFDSKR